MLIFFGLRSILLILYDTQYFRGVDNPYTKRYEVIPGDRYCFYETLRSIFGASILLILSDTQYFRGNNTPYTKWYAVFPRGRCCFYETLHRIFGWSILRILIDTQYFRRSILHILRITHYFHGAVDTPYSKQYLLFSGGPYCTYQALCSIYRGSILLIISDTQ